MNIHAIAPSFKGRRDRVDEMIALDDASIQKLAYLKTVSNSDDKKFNKLANGLFAAAPVAAGISVAVFTKGKTKIFSKEVSGLAAKLAIGLKTGTLFAAGLAAIGLVGKAKDELSKSSADVRKFDREHPFLSLGTLFVAGLGALTLVNKGATKLAGVKAPEFLQKITERTSNFLNNNKKIKSLNKNVNKLAEKTPPVLKDLGAKLINWSPVLLMLGGLFTSLSHKGAVQREYNKNYIELKEKQLNLSKARQQELAMENDFLKTNARNREDVALVKDPLNGLPDEVIEKAAEIQENVEE